MYISKLSLRNYRNFRNETVGFVRGVNTIIGENASGKSNLLTAIRYLIDDSMPRGLRFTETDFNRSLESWKGHWIIIQITFEELDPNEEAQSIAMHKIGKMDEFEATIGSYALYCRPRTAFRTKLYDYSQEGDKTQEGLQELLDEFTLNDYEVVFRGRGNTDFSDDDVYKEYVGDFENIEFPDPSNEQQDVFGTKIHGMNLSTELSCTYA